MKNKTTAICLYMYYVHCINNIVNIFYIIACSSGSKKGRGLFHSEPGIFMGAQYVN